MFRLFRYLKPVWYLVILAMLIVALQSYLQLMLPDFIRNVTEIVGTANSQAPGYNPDWSSELLIQGGWMLLIAISGFVCAIIQGLLNSYTASVLARNIRKAVFDKVINEMSLSEYNTVGIASLLTRTTNDVDQVRQTYYMAVRVVVMAPMIMIIAIVKIFLSTSPELVWIPFTTMGACIVIIVIVFITVYPIVTKIQESTDRVTLAYREGITGVRVIRAFNQQSVEKTRFDKQNDYFTSISLKVGRVMAILSPVIMVIFNLSFMGTYIVGIGANDGAPLSNLTSIGQIAAIAMLIMNVMNSFMMMAMVLLIFPQALASSRRINQILDIKSNITDPKYPVPVSLIEPQGVVEFDNVTFGYPDSEVPFLKNLNFKTNPGKITAIIGTTGSGKSTLINLIPRFYDPSEGQIRLDGVDIKRYNISDLRSRIGFVPQQAVLFSGTIRSNLDFGKENATEDEMKEALDVAQALRFVEKKENGLDAEVSQGGKNFSGGQKQRLSIARALIKKPSLYIFDDSFSALDFKTDIRLRKALKTFLGEHSSAIIVAQRVASILDADNILVVQDGVVVAQGKHTELLLKSEAYKEIVLSQLDPEEIEKTLAIQHETLTGGDQ